jgi:hypothetical protein
MITRAIIISMLGIVFYTYLGYGLVVWIMLKWRKMKIELWSFLK